MNDIIRTQEMHTSKLLRGIDKWSEMALKHENPPGETLGATVEMTVLQDMCPEEVRSHLPLNARRLMRARDVKAGLLAYSNAQQASVGATPMEVDGVREKRES